MAQKKGKTGNPNGRPLGSPNKTTKELRDLLHSFLLDVLDKEKLEAIIKEASPGDRLRFLAKIIDSVIPPPVADPPPAKEEQSHREMLLERMKKEGAM